MVKSGVSLATGSSPRAQALAIPAGLVRAKLSQKLFKVSNAKAVRTLAVSVVLVVAAFWSLSVIPTLLLPLGWLMAAAASLGVFAIANDCAAHRFFTSRSLNDVVGAVCFLPMLYPLASWQWHQRQVNAVVRKAQPLHRVLVPFYWLLDAVRGVWRYYDLEKFEASEIARARASVSAVYAFGICFFSLMTVYGGVWPLVKYWLAPWLIFHFGKNLLLRQVLPVVYDRATNSAKLSYVKLPSFLEALCHNVNFIVPDNLALDVPCYNLDEARRSLCGSNTASIKVVDHAVPSVLNQMWHASVSDVPRRRRRRRRPKVTDETAPPASVRTDKKTDAATTLAPEAKTWSNLTGRMIDFLRHDVNWLHAPLLLGTPLIALYGFYSTPLLFKTFAFAVVYYFMTGIGITGGYHRLWAHRGYDASLPVRLLLLCWASGAVEGSARWWCRDHRAHHRFTDTDRDPYTITKGFFYAHIGWMLVKQDPAKIGRSDISDLNADPWLRFQHRQYLWWALFFGFVFPTLVAGLGWGDYWGGFYFAAVARLVFVHHATFCVNSLAHYVGSHTYADTHTPRDHFITALLTLGEGYHNFHHEFPQDYRNAIRWYQYDPTKLFIRTLAFFGLTYNLHRFPQNEIHKGALQIAEKNLAKRRAKLDWGPEPSSVEVMTRQDVKESDKLLMIIDGFVYDAEEFAPSHPGGKIIESFKGKDATTAFAGGVYAHSRAARNLLHTMLVGRLPDTPVVKPDLEDALKPTFVSSSSDESSEEHWHGPLAHISVARPQGEPIQGSAYEIDFPIVDSTKAN